MNNYHDKINKITELATIPKQLSPEAVDKLRSEIEAHIERTGNDDLAELLPIIITYIYNQSYLACINDVLDILRGK